MATQNVQKAPKVRKIKDIMTELNPAVQPSIDLANEQMALIQPQLQADLAGTEQGRVNAFRQITNLANRRGMTFSGIPIQEQARYVGEKFFPKQARLQQGAQQERIRIRDIIAGIQRDAYMQAFNTREGDRNNLFSYNSAEANRAFTKSEREASQAYNTKERVAAQEFQAQQNALAASQAGISSGTADFDSTAAISTVNEFLRSNAGSDGRVNPDTFQYARSKWAEFGGNPAYFDETFKGFVNPIHAGDYFLDPNLPMSPDGGAYTPPTTTSQAAPAGTTNVGNLSGGLTWLGSGNTSTPVPAPVSSNNQLFNKGGAVTPISKLVNAYPRLFQ